MFEIESGVPIPAGTRSTKGQTKYPFAAMQVGQSFAVPIVPGEDGKTENRLRGAAMRFAKEQGGTVKFSVRVMDDVVRVWRVA